MRMRAPPKSHESRWLWLSCGWRGCPAARTCHGTRKNHVASSSPQRALNLRLESNLSSSTHLSLRFMASKCARMNLDRFRSYRATHALTRGFRSHLLLSLHDNSNWYFPSRGHNSGEDLINHGISCGNWGRRKRKGRDVLRRVNWPPWVHVFRPIPVSTPDRNRNARSMRSGRENERGWLIQRRPPCPPLLNHALPPPNSRQDSGLAGHIARDITNTTLAIRSPSPPAEARCILN